MTKKVVNYTGSIHLLGIENCCAIVTPINHPDHNNVTNTKQVVTSRIVKMPDENGCFETENTIYEPVNMIKAGLTD